MTRWGERLLRSCRLQATEIVTGVSCQAHIRLPFICYLIIHDFDNSGSFKGILPAPNLHPGREPGIMAANPYSGPTTRACYTRSCCDLMGCSAGATYRHHAVSCLIPLDRRSESRDTEWHLSAHRSSPAFIGAGASTPQCRPGICRKRRGPLLLRDVNFHHAHRDKPEQPVVHPRQALYAPSL